ncbi:MAG TPA: amidohydrolase, partial [Gammaproteobacteria bacterium]|nr:amidohydrolase [Gammaproteobacteria bacterium]
MIKPALLTLLLLPVTACAADSSEEKDWDVNNPPGPAKSVEIDVTEGTWINLDVSPDGETVVFDLLGDLFVIPIEGGEAEQLTAGMAWDMQPRYSPDGSAIAFTSDRSGGDNIWIMRLADNSFHQVTDEDFRLLNNPVWTPDGNYIAARKHYTGTRSLGAGEIWLYHRSGGEGVQMVARANEQKDINDPAFSPDGRYLYYDQDVTPGDTFEYNKDSNGEIYAIKRLDRKTGETITYVSGAGGSIRPTPSPDGKWLAFIRRVRFQSTLFLKNIESGDIFPVYDDMERDMQEIWAIHGVYTGMDWTPDSQSLVFWADGHIKRLNIESREVSTIPFHVEKSMEIRPALRYPVDIAPDNFKTRMLRWATVSPDGNQAVFEALGHLYMRPLGNDAEAQRLTEQTTHFELQPAFSRDGRYLAYVTWDDKKLGTLRVRDLLTGEEIQLNRKPGHFVEPVFSPDGKTVVFRRITGGYLRAPRWDEHPGVYAVPADGSAAPRLITKDGYAPQFGANNNRLFLTRMEKYDKRLLVSLELDGSDLRTHFTSTWATDFKVSPQGRWVAFQERYNVYIAPFTRSGQAIEIGPDTKSIPVQRVSAHGGNYLHWAGDGRSLHWSLGPKLMSRALNQTFAFLEGGPDEADDIPEPGADAIDLGFEQAFAVPNTRLALVGARILTMDKAGIIEDGAIIIEGNRISAVGPRSDIELPANMPVLDVSGKTIMPGIIDVHWHGAQGTDEFIPEQNWVNYASLAFGVTTLHDPSNDTSTIFAASELAKAGLITAPRIFSTGTILYGATTAFTTEIDSYEDALHHLKRLKAQGAFSVKSYNQPRRDQRQQIIAAARELEVKVVPEGGALFQHNMNMIVDGH